MSDFFEIFNPGQRYTREQLETEKLLVVHEAQAGTGPQPLDLDSGAVVLRLPAPAPETPDAETSDPATPEAEASDVEPDDPAS